MPTRTDLLDQAFKNQAADGNKWRELHRESRYPTAIALESEPYAYNGVLPEGIQFLGRSDSFSGVGEPFVIFDLSVDMELMGQTVHEFFGENVELVYNPIDKSINVRSMDPEYVSSQGKLMFAYGPCPFQKFYGLGMVEYYTDSPPMKKPQDTTKIIQILDIYLGQINRIS